MTEPATDSGTVGTELLETHCTIHAEPLLRGVATIIWGLPVITRAERDARRQLFPMARSLTFGGCMSTSNAETEAPVWDAEQWFQWVVHEELQAAIEQCCHSGQLLSAEVRALRLQRFSHRDQVRTEFAIQNLPEDQGAAALVLICWWVRIERAKTDWLARAESAPFTSRRGPRLRA